MASSCPDLRFSGYVKCLSAIAELPHRGVVTSPARAPRYAQLEATATRPQAAPQIKDGPRTQSVPARIWPYCLEIAGYGFTLSRGRLHVTESTEP